MTGLPSAFIIPHSRPMRVVGVPFGCAQGRPSEPSVEALTKVCPTEIIIRKATLMTHLPLLLIIAALALTNASVIFAADAPAPPAATTQPSMGEVRVQSLRGYTYCFISAQ